MARLDARVRLAITLINLAYTALEAGYGFATNSLALLSDALHNFGDVLGLGLAWGAAVLAQRPPTDRHTYGWRRATLLSPLANAMLLVAFSGALGWEAIRRFGAPPQIPAMPVMVVAAIGIFVNLGAAWLLRDGHGHDLNRRGAFLHLMADAAVSLAAVLAGAGMLAFGWALARPGDRAAGRRGDRGRRLRPAARQLQRGDGCGARQHRPAAVQAFLPTQPGVSRGPSPAYLAAGRGRNRHDRAPGARRRRRPRRLHRRASCTNWTIASASITRPCRSNAAGLRARPATMPRRIIRIEPAALTGRGFARAARQ